jgi:hypothetical protein
MIGLCVVVDRKSCNLGEDPKNKQCVGFIGADHNSMTHL